MVFKDGSLGGACHFWGDPYLNGTTVLFDTYVSPDITMLVIKRMVINVDAWFI